MSNIDPSIADEAIKLVTGDRQAAYGHPSRNFQDIADLWSPILGLGVSAEQVALCMVQVKIAREIHNPKRDNLVDAVGYLLTYNATLHHNTVMHKACSESCGYCKDVC